MASLRTGRSSEKGIYDAARQSREGLAHDLLLVSLGTVLLLALLAGQVDFSRLHAIGHFNDQTGYVTSARHWVDTGRLESLVVYPAMLGERLSRRVIYMPGYYACLAGSYLLFGYGVWQSLLPSAAAFLMAAAAIFVTARRLFGRPAAFLAAALFAASPLNQLYAFLAMAEMPFVAAVAVAIAAFVYVPLQHRPLIGPLLLVPPFLFRETGALVVVLFAALIWCEGRRGVRRAVTLLGLSVVLLGAIQQSPISKGRPSLFAANFFEDERAKYFDAKANQRLEVSASEVARRLPARICRQLTALFPEIDPASPPVYLLHAGLLALGPLGLWFGWRRRDGWLLGTAGMALCLLLLSAALYTCAGMTFSRMTMFVHVPLAVLCGRELARWLARIKPASAATLRCACSLAVVLPIGGSTLLYCRDAHALLARQSREAGILLDAIDAAVTPPPGKLAVIDVEMLPIYVLEHYPVEGAMMPVTTRRSTNCGVIGRSVA